ncbi:hypothetical protein, partial [Streptomyces sp. NPDC097619]|uniref:hypothetical protein n=1 Tax=Streptomyces sp. NPDC097619 TaxID=3157228 RepID=UPI0033290B10
MEELAYVVGKVLRGAAGAAYAFGDVLVGLGPEGGTKKKAEEESGKGSAKGSAALAPGPPESGVAAAEGDEFLVGALFDHA